MAIEIDGGYHDDQFEQDQTRQDYLQDHGWKVICFDDGDVVSDVEAVAISLARHIGVVPIFRGERLTDEAPVIGLASWCCENSSIGTYSFANGLTQVHQPTPALG